MSVTLFIPMKDYVEKYWPKDILELPSLDAFDSIWLEPIEVDYTPSLTVYTSLLFETELAVSIPGLDAVKLVFAPNGSYTSFAFELATAPVPRFRIVDIPIALRLDSSLLKPARRVRANEPGKPDSFEPDTSTLFVDITLAKITLAIDADGNISIDGAASISLPPTYIGDTGVVVEASEIGIFLDAACPPPGKPAGWRGVHIAQASLYLPGELAGIVGNLALTDAYIGNGGFSGTVSDTWAPALSSTLFGMQISLNQVALTFIQNTLTQSEIHGMVTLPFFDQPLGVDIALSIDGSFTVALSKEQPDGVKYQSESGLVTFERKNLLRLVIESVGFQVKDGVFITKLSGQITPLFGNYTWPSFKVKELSIDSDGNVHLDGGWLNLPDQCSFDFYGFKMEITKLGFGKTDDGGKWVGFSGSLKLVEGLKAGGSVEGLRIIWYDDGRSTSMTLNGAGVEFEVPNALYFKGAVAYQDILGGGRFDGAIKVELTSLNMEIDGTLVIGSEAGNTYFAIYLNAELPAGIPLWSTGLALYGMAGLYALDMEPNKQDTEEWYGMEAPGWYQRNPVGITDLKGKWAFQSGSFALGAGVTIGTLSDNGYAFSGKMLLVIVFPGPILLLEGKANILSKRASQDREALFRSITVLDARAGTFLIGIDAQYKYGSKSELIGINASAEAFFSLSDASAWHLYMGLKDPREKRIRAEVFRLFEAGSYFMLDAHQLALGAWIGYKKQWSFGPLGVTAEAWIEGNALISWNPMHLHGDLWLHGKAALKVFGFSLGLSIDAGIAADVFHPFEVMAQLKVGIDLPWFLPDFDVDITLEWKDEQPASPPLPLPLKEIAVEHLKVTTSWPLPRGTLLLPNYDADADGFLDPTPEQEASGVPAQVPVVPLDARPHLTFSRSINDDAWVGENKQSVVPEWEQIGDPTKENEGPVQVRYGLKEVTLAKRIGQDDPPQWEPVASKVADLSQEPDPKISPQKWQTLSTGTLFGSWAPVPAVPDNNGQNVGQVKLWLWSKTPFDYTRHSGRAWDEWFTQRFRDYPCIQPADRRVICCDFDRLDRKGSIKQQWRCSTPTGSDGEEWGYVLSWQAPADQTVTVLGKPAAGFRQAFCFPATYLDPSTGVERKNQVRILLLQPAQSVRILLAEESTEESAWIDFTALPGGSGPNPRIEHDARIGVRGAAGAFLSTTQIDTLQTAAGPLAGLNCGFSLEIALPTPSSFVELTLTRFGQPALVEAFNEDGGLVATRLMQYEQGVPETLNLEAEAIRFVNVRAPGNETLLHQVSFGRPPGFQTQVEATGSNQRGDTYGPVSAVNNQIDVKGEALTEVRLEGTDRFCLVQICATLGPDPAEVAQREEMAQHLVEETAHWSQEGYVLEPHTTYRLKVVTSIQRRDDDQGTNYTYDKNSDNKTEFAYFRTEGPPGLTHLSLPIGKEPLTKAGTVAVTNGETAVTGIEKTDETGTTVKPEWSNLLVGAVLQVEGDATGYTVAQVRASNTLELGQAYQGSTRSDVPYSITQLDSGLNDLTPYVRQTVPATVPAAGEKPPLPRPVYRAYDVGVEFNENYVEQMYRMERRDLGLYLYDNNNRPVRDAQGRLIVLSNRWRTAEQLILTESETRGIWVVNASDCGLHIDTRNIPHDNTLASAAEGQVLDPDTVYEARLVPLLLHEGFTEDLAQWQPFDEEQATSATSWETRGHQTLTGDAAIATGTTVKLDGSPDLSKVTSNKDIILLDNDSVRPSGYYRIVDVNDAAKTVTVDGSPNLADGSSPWHIPRWGAVVQTASTGGGSSDARDPVKPGTLLLRADYPALPGDHPDQPANWTDYRLSVFLRSAEGGAIGIVFRYRDSANYYRFSMDRQQKYRRLVRVVKGVHTILAEDDFVYQLNRDYLITVEAVGSSLRLYQDGAPVFNVEESSLKDGRIGLYCWKSAGAQFSDVRVDDFRLGAPVVYRFQFTTSQFTNFFHHLHSYQDETWPAALPADTTLVDQLAYAVPLPSDLGKLAGPAEEEARAYETLASLVLGPSASPTPAEVQVMRVEQGTGPEKQVLALLVQGPEPIDWRRTALSLWNAPVQVPLPALPGTAKLTDVSFGADQPNEESVTLLLRDSGDLTGMRIEQRCLPGPLAAPTSATPLLVDTFGEAHGGLLLREEFGPNALDHYTIVDEGTESESSHWAVSDGEMVQTSARSGGTLALTGSAAWTDIRVNTVLYPPFNAEVGLIFRYVDENTYYRFSLEHRRIITDFPPYHLTFCSRRLIKNVQGQVHELWQDTPPSFLGRPYHLEINACGDQLVGYLDDALLFCLHDRDSAAGQVGFYCARNPHAHFNVLEVTSIAAPLVLWQPPFAGLDEVQVVVEEGTTGGPASWEVRDGALIQTSALYGEDGVLLHPGTYALGGSASWHDVQISAGLRSDTSGDLGVMLRYQDQDNYYRFSMGHLPPPSPATGYRRLIKKAGGAITVLWQDEVPYVEARRYELTLRLVGNELSGILDGAPLFTVYDSDLKGGQVGFYCWQNSGAVFDRVVVTDRTRRVGRWTIHDEGTVGAPSVWKLSNGRLVQTASIDGGSTPAAPGTYAVAGEQTWGDYRLVVKMRSDEPHAIGVLFRYSDDDHYYRLSLDAEHNDRRLVKKEHGLVTTLWEASQSYTPGEDVTLTVDAIGSRLVGYLGAERLFEVTDGAHASGRVGLYCWGNSGARFERVEVLPPPLETQAWFRDYFASGDRSGWSVINEGTVDGPSSWNPAGGWLCQTSNIYLPPDDRDTLGKQGTQAVAGDPTWTDVLIRVRVQSFDDDAIGLLFRYTDAQHYYRFSMDSQRSYQRLVKNEGGTFTLLWERAVSYEVGRSYELSVLANGNLLRGFLDGIPLFVVEDRELTEESALTRGQIGLYCWANDNARFSQVRVYPANLAYDGWVLDEPFAVLVRDRWRFVEEGDLEKPMQWAVTDGELRQSSAIASSSSGPDIPGTYAYTGETTWTDYRICVRLCSDTGGALGMMLRYQDQDNYYRFSMGLSIPSSPSHPPVGYRRLIKKVAGVVTVLWEDAVPYVRGQEYVVTIDGVGEQLSGYIDGLPLFVEEDKDLAAGGIGLYCSANAGARFLEVRVATPQWVPYYTFGQEERLSAGTRVKVYAGNEQHAPPAEPGVIRRFKAPLDEPGRLELEAKGAMLRLRAPGKTEGHQRFFLPEGKYRPADASRLLRKADGTGFLLVAPSTSEAGSLLVPGQYRLDLTYYRDIQSVDPANQVFSEAGNTNPEQARLAISLPGEFAT